MSSYSIAANSNTERDSMNAQRLMYARHWTILIKDEIKSLTHTTENILFFDKSPVAITSTYDLLTPSLLPNRSISLSLLLSTTFQRNRVMCYLYSKGFLSIRAVMMMLFRVWPVQSTVRSLVNVYDERYVGIFKMHPTKFWVCSGSMHGRACLCVPGQCTWHRTINLFLKCTLSMIILFSLLFLFTFDAVTHTKTWSN